MNTRGFGHGYFFVGAGAHDGLLPYMQLHGRGVEGAASYNKNTQKNRKIF